MDREKLTGSKTFCMAPWTHMHFMPNKDVNPCCLSPIQETIGRLETNSIVEVWNSDDMRQLRKDMIDGNDCSRFCHRCYEKEEDGFTSLRTHMNESYAEKHWDVVESTTEDGYVDELNLIHWDFRFSNICNQRCRTCGIEFSTQWHDDYVAMWNLTPEQAPPKVKKIWSSVEAFEYEFETLFDKVEYIHFAGGEPLITDEHYRILERLIEAEQTNVRIRYSTNFGTLKYKQYDVVEMWKHFDHIELVASLDDLGPRYEYLRKGGKWDTIVDNFNRLKESGLFDLGNIYWGIHPTISLFNVYYMPDFHAECIRLGMVDPKKTNNHFSTAFHLNNLIFPPHYSCQALPADLKVQVTDKLLKYADEIESKYGIEADPFRNIVTHMNAEDQTNQLRKTRQLTQQLDTIRNENVREVFPFLGDLFA